MALTKALRVQCFKRDNYHCRHCNNTNGLHPHHIVYRSAGGPDELDNLIILCWICHRAVHDGFLKIRAMLEDGTAIFVRLRGWKP